MTYYCLRCGYTEMEVERVGAPAAAVRYETPRCWECLTEGEVAQIEADPSGVDEGTYFKANGEAI